ncbi:MAG: 4-(cytidine 5'-diphospho)-2-C-methyl-D-erythritol kinase [Alphaproteobacteria bacterium]|nr:4-(cytidine 5'-diphospho)-2-C-methyl-D-erythritol kinase [Alphaproteobacteria bacterium]
MTAPLWTAQPPVTVSAPAKVNLFLHITGRRKNGYHELESLFAFTKGGDRVTISTAPSYSFSLEGPFAEALREAGGEGENNLVSKAVRLLAGRAGLEAAVAVTLEKNLPVAAGIGGGSADAAATLIALDAFWKLKLSTAELEKIALELGADVPACLHKTPLMVRGIGEDLTPVKLGWKGGILLVNPMVPLPTPSVFGAYKDQGSPFDGRIEDIGSLLAGASSLKKAHNALEAPAIAVCPAVREVLKCLAPLPDVQLVRMSGSGATCFALFDSAACAQKAGQRLKAQQPDWWMMVDTLE